MLKSWHLIFIAGLLSSSAYAQLAVPGYIVTNHNEVIHGAIRIQDPVKQQHEVEFIALNGQGYTRFDGSQLMGYGYITKKDTVRYISTVATAKTEHGKASRLFLRQLCAGPVQLLDYYFPVYYSGISQSQYVTNYRYQAPPASYLGRVDHSVLVWRAGQAGFVETRAWKFPQEVAEYFADYPALKSDLHAGRYRRRDLQAIVRRYNTWQLAQTTNTGK
ncbi:hypothetical protein [Hymenobacter jejuensis]|uniref:Uncharacterized protein n=1 Tax=Hymenobacter jejuensis TaxID=2502781 RepID=A0A5B7ZY16_9BACT|nr:hypothetical protein [Hymenobacter jejuensis]QDA59767.1 hypothetical protein FHG12_06450 [Hymenobacter jejuensis]